MKAYENKVSYGITFEIGPRYDLDPKLFLEGISDYVSHRVRDDPEMVFVDPEYADHSRDAVRLNLLVASPEEAAAKLRSLFQKERFRTFRYASDIAAVYDSKGQQLYPPGHLRVVQ